MMFWWCDQSLNGGAVGRAFPTMDRVFALEGEQITWSPLSRVVRVECEGKRYKWRNLLVTNGDAPTVYLFDRPSGGCWWGPFLQYRIVKELACLDKVAKYHLTRTQRLRFFLDYVQRRRLTEADKTRVRKIIGFFEGRE